MSRENDLHLLTAYALGELQGAEKTRIENLIRNDPVLQKTVKEIQKAAGMLAQDLRAAEPSLSSFEKSKLERGWQELAQNESKPGFFRSLFGPIPALAATAAAVVIVLFVTKSNITEELRRGNSEIVARKAPSDLAAPEYTPPPPAEKLAKQEPPAADAAATVESAAPSESKDIESDRKALFVKIEKKEVNPEVGSANRGKESIYIEPKGESKRSADEAGFGAGGGLSAGGATNGIAKGSKSDLHVAGVKAKQMAQGVAPPSSEFRETARSAAPAKPAMSKKAQAAPMSVMFGGDGEQVTGAPDSRGVKEVLRGTTAQYVTCYSSALEAQPGTKGKLILKWKIKKGRATGVSVASSALGNSGLETCVINTLKKAHFGPESNGANVVMPFHFMTPN